MSKIIVINNIPAVEIDENRIFINGKILNRFVATVARAGSKCANFCRYNRKGIRFIFSRPVWTGAIYELRPRQKDGVLTYRRIKSFGGTRSGSEPSDKFIKYLKEKTSHPFILGVRHGMEAK